MAHVPVALSYQASACRTFSDSGEEGQRQENLNPKKDVGSQVLVLSDTKSGRSVKNWKPQLVELWSESEGN